MYQKQQILALGFVETVLVGPLRYQFGLFFHQLSQQFQESDFMIYQIVAASNWTYLISCIVMGFLNDKLGIANIKLMAAIAVTLSLIIGSNSHNIQAMIGLQHFLYFAVCVMDITVTISIKDHFEPESMPKILSFIRSGSGLGNFFMSLIFGSILKFVRWDVCFTILGLTINVIYIIFQIVLKQENKINEKNNYLIINNSERKNSKLVCYDDTTFVQEFTKPLIIYAFSAMLISNISQMLIQDWTIKQFISIGRPYDDGASIIQSISLLSFVGRLVSYKFIEQTNIFSFYIILYSWSIFTQFVQALSNNQQIIICVTSIYGLFVGSASSQQGFFARLIFSDKWQNKGLSMLQTTIGLSFLLGSYLSPILIDNQGYIITFIFQSCTQFISVILFYFAMTVFLKTQSNNSDCDIDSNIVNQNELKLQMSFDGTKSALKERSTQSLTSITKLNKESKQIE